MSLGAQLLALALVLVCVHVALLLVVLARALLPRRRDGSASVGLLAGACALVGDLLVLGALVGRPTPPGWTLGLLALALVAGVWARATWRTTPAGRAAFYALFAAPLALLVLAALAFR